MAPVALTGSPQVGFPTGTHAIEQSADHIPYSALRLVVAAKDIG